MRGVYIKGMEMPKTCMNGGCPIDGKYCDLWWKIGGGSYGRHKDCPLIEIQDHGDLIDKSVLYDHIKDGYDIDLQENPILLNAILEMVDYQEAVIPAGRSEE